MASSSDTFMIFFNLECICQVDLYIYSTAYGAWRCDIHRTMDLCLVSTRLDTAPCDKCRLIGIGVKHLPDLVVPLAFQFAKKPG